MEFTAKQIAEMVGGRVEGDPEVKVSAFAKIEEGKQGALSFLSNPKYAHYLYQTQSSVVLVNDDLQTERAVQATLIRVKNAYEAVAHLLQLYEQMKPRKTGVSPMAFVEPTAQIGKDVYIGPFSYIGDGVSIGDGTRIMPNVTIYEGCRVGRRCLLHAGCVIGADGFGFAPGEQGYDKIPQIGIVVIEDDVEIGANTCVDRSTMGATVIHRGVKLDNLVQVAHNCEVGQNTVMSAQVGLAGSTKVGEWCMLGGQVGLAGHITIGNRVHIGAQSGVIGNVADGQTILGTPPMEPKAFFRSQAIFRRLPDMYRQMAQMQKEIDELKKQNSN